MKGSTVRMARKIIYQPVIHTVWNIETCQIIDLISDTIYRPPASNATSSDRNVFYCCTGWPHKAAHLFTYCNC